VIRIYTAASSHVGTCDHCNEYQETIPDSPGQVITVVTLHRGDTLVCMARFCERHFLQFSDLISDQVAVLLYPRARTSHP
jgi:hypothetical protein